MYDLLLLLLHKHLLGSLHFFLLNTEEKVSHVFLILPAELKGSVRTYRVLLLLSPAVTVVTLRVGLHGHGGEEILHCIVAQIVTDLSKLQQVSGSIESTLYKLPQPLNVNPARITVTYLRTFCTKRPATTPIVVGKLAAQTPSRFSVFSSMLAATTSGGAH